ncbi:hypothetical protein SAMN04488132_101322 [Sediminibacterium ginsengisoli]|uniref:Uncharacterized protein n=2 Tax=Sediminibacterium ginsengisoli TaxID=413434 RepID=A0A1T4JZ35_9BACT|nr:hypothetical protein SAMN04488132_101322 [Sediminibacterium ginsengisoli]
MQDPKNKRPGNEETKPINTNVLRELQKEDKPDKSGAATGNEQVTNADPSVVNGQGNNDEVEEG